MQDHGLREQKQINPLIIRLSRETGIPLVVTNDTHYIDKEDARVQQVLICIQTNHTVGEETGLEFETQEFYLKSEEEMRLLFPELPEAFDNTVKIAQRCNVTFTFGETKLPHFDVPGGRIILNTSRGCAKRGSTHAMGSTHRRIIATACIMS